MAAAPPPEKHLNTGYAQYQISVTRSVPEASPTPSINNSMSMSMETMESSIGSDYCPEIPASEVQFCEHIGAGHTCEVFRGVVRGQQVAIKKTLGQVISDDTLARELTIMCLARHPNIVNLLGMMNTTTTTAIVM